MNGKPRLGALVRGLGALCVLLAACGCGPPPLAWKLYAKLNTYYCYENDTIQIRTFLDDSRGVGWLERGCATWSGHENTAMNDDGEPGWKLRVESCSILVRRPDSTVVEIASDGVTTWPSEWVTTWDALDAFSRSKYKKPPELESPYREPEPIEVKVSAFSIGPGEYEIRLFAVAERVKPLFSALLYSPVCRLQILPGRPAENACT